MRKALGEAERAFRTGEVPVGAAAVYQGRVIALTHNLCESLKDPTAHAELLAIRQAASELGSYRLLGVDLYVTVEPCVMCTGALHLARIARVIYGCSDPKGGALGSQYCMHLDGRLNHRLEVLQGIEEEACRGLMQNFFRRLRDPGMKSAWGDALERWPSLAEGD
jgi:tRNA(adenine34) deaminase